MRPNPRPGAVSGRRLDVRLAGCARTREDDGTVVGVVEAGDDRGFAAGDVQGEEVAALVDVDELAVGGPADGIEAWAEPRWRRADWGETCLRTTGMPAVGAVAGLYPALVAEYETSLMDSSPVDHLPGRFLGCTPPAPLGASST